MLLRHQVKVCRLEDCIAVESKVVWNRMPTMNEDQLIRKAMAALGSRTSRKKAAAARANGAKPCRAGRRRGRPRKHTKREE
jgi:hypothetical protein